MYHGAGFSRLIRNIAMGIKSVFETEFEVEKMLKAVETYKVSRIEGNPSFIKISELMMLVGNCFISAMVQDNDLSSAGDSITSKYAIMLLE